MNSKRNSTVSDNGVNIFYTTMIVAPIGDYKATTGDKVIKGNITLDINKIAEWMNNYPRKIFDYHTPKEMLEKEKNTIIR